MNDGPTHIERRPTRWPLVGRGCLIVLLLGLAFACVGLGQALLGGV